MNDREIACRGGSSSREKRLRGRHIALFAALLTLGAAAFPSAALAFQPFIYISPTATPSMTSASLNASIYPYGSETHYHWDLGTSTNYSAEVPVGGASAGSAPYPGISSVNQTAMSLTPNTTYHFRLVATNSDGTLTTPDQTFTTTGTPPTVTDEAATEVAGGFELKGTVNPNGSAATYQFEYGTSISYGSKVPASETSVGSGSSAVPVSQTISSLLANTEYHFRLTAGRGTGHTVMTADKTFTTPPAAPSAPSAVASTPQAITGGFRLEGEVNPNSLQTTYHFAFGTSSTLYGTNIPASDVSIGSGSSGVAVMQDVTTGLLPNTTYHYKIVANNSKGNGESADEQFTTPPLKPVVSTLPVSESAEGFTLHGTVNPNGGPTTYHFDFGITEGYGQSIPGSEVSVGSGTEPVSLSQLVKGLPSGVPYHYRIVATNAGGVTMGEDRFFMTPPAASTPEAPQLLPLVVPPPSPAPPSNQLTVKPAVARGAGATMQISVPGAGTVSATGKGLKTVTVTSKGPGVVTLKLKLTGAGMAQLRKAPSHKLTVKVKIAFQPNGGRVGTTSKTVTFKLGGT